MISVEQAWELIRAAMPPRATREVALDQCYNAVLAQAVAAERDQPPFDRVMMDGIAIASGAVRKGRKRFSVQATQAAGAGALTLRSDGHCIEIMTGAALPRGTDTIVPVEKIDRDGDSVVLAGSANTDAGQFIHPQGSDYRRGAALLSPGVRLGGPEMAVLASSGLGRVRIADTPAIAIIAVGDELVDPGEPIGSHQIRRSNDFAIAALLHAHGLRQVERMRLPDDPAMLADRIGEAVSQHDVVVLTGGVSMGKYDYIPSIMKKLGVDIVFHKIAQRPGKPMWFGRRDKAVVFALPGNPVSSLVCARRYVVSAIAASMGAKEQDEQVRIVTAAGTPAGLTWFPAVTLEPNGGAQIKPTNSSGDFYSLATTAGFIEWPAGRGRCEPGDIARLWRW